MREKPRWKTIRIKDDTHENLLRIQSMLQLIHGRRFSIDDVIAFLLERLPPVEVSWRALEESDKSSGEKLLLDEGREDADKGGHPEAPR